MHKLLIPSRISSLKEASFTIRPMSLVKMCKMLHEDGRSSSYKYKCIYMGGGIGIASYQGSSSDLINTWSHVTYFWLKTSPTHPLRKCHAIFLFWEFTDWKSPGMVSYPESVNPNRSTQLFLISLFLRLLLFCQTSSQAFIPDKNTMCNLLHQTGSLPDPWISSFPSSITISR